MICRSTSEYLGPNHKKQYTKRGKDALLEC